MSVPRGPPMLRRRLLKNWGMIWLLIFSLPVYQLNSPNAARRKHGGYTSSPDSVSLKLDDLFFQYQ
jgi:hypothetical protein